jgi:acetolactate synthase-1/2/3 large subunit
MSKLPKYRPVVLVGRGYRLSGDYDRLGIPWKCPILTTWRAADMVEDDHPLFFGRPGSLAPRYANLIVQNATHLDIRGARLDLPQVGYDPQGFAPSAGRCRLDWTDNCDEWIARCRRWKDAYPIIKPEYQKSECVNQYVFFETLSDILTMDDIIVVGSSGQASDIFYPTFKVKKGQRIISSPGLGAMGFAIPAAIGASLASGRRVICIEGDGSLQLNMQELETIRRLDLNIKIFVLNNGGYATIRNTSKRHFEGRDHTAGMTFHGASQQLAHDYGIYCAGTIKFNYDMASHIKWALDHVKEPFLCVVNCDPDLELSPRLHSTIVDGKIIPGRLEDVS